MLSTNYLLTAAAVFNNEWEYKTGSCGLGVDRGMLFTDKKNAKAEITFENSQKDTFTAWIRYRGGPPLGKVKILLDEKNEYLIDQNGPDRFTWKKIDKIEVNKGKHTIVLLNSEGNPVSFDSIYLTNNIFCIPKVNNFNTDIIDNKLFNIITDLSKIIIYAFIYIMLLCFVYFICNSTKTRIKELIRKSKIYFKLNLYSPFLFISIMFLGITCYLDICLKPWLASVMGVCVFVCIVMGFIVKLYIFRKSD